MAKYTLYCVHRGNEHWLQAGSTLAEVAAPPHMVVKWMSAMDVHLDDAFPTMLVIREDGVPIRRAQFSSYRYKWRVVESPEQRPALDLP